MVCVYLFLVYQQTLTVFTRLEDFKSRYLGRKMASICFGSAQNESLFRAVQNVFLKIEREYLRYFEANESLFLCWDNISNKTLIDHASAGSYYGLPSKVTVRPTPSEVSSLNYFCQHCLVHLGDLARYRSQPRQAETFYRQAIQIAPGNGQAYNQIGLLESVLPRAENKLAAVFFYVRSIALR